MQQVIIKRADGSEINTFGTLFASDVNVVGGVLSLENTFGIVDFWYKLQPGESVSLAPVEESA